MQTAYFTHSFLNPCVKTRVRKRVLWPYCWVRFFLFIKLPAGGSWPCALFGLGPSRPLNVEGLICRNLQLVKTLSFTQIMYFTLFPQLNSWESFLVFFKYSHKTFLRSEGLPITVFLPVQNSKRLQDFQTSLYFFMDRWKKMCSPIWVLVLEQITDVTFTTESNLSNGSSLMRTDCEGAHPLSGWAQWWKICRPTLNNSRKQITSQKNPSYQLLSNIGTHL